ncbi:GLY-15 protein [Aphelenchoides avenae]|nr:GLY-15 protein [Aphelenchus avenae]
MVGRCLVFACLATAGVLLLAANILLCVCVYRPFNDELNSLEAYLSEETTADLTADASCATQSTTPFYDWVLSEMRVVHRRRVDLLMSRLPLFKGNVQCDAVFDNDTAVIQSAKRWRFSGDAFWIETMESATRRDNFINACQNIKENFAFFDEPLSREEHDFPLAYGILVHENAVQVYLMLSAIYQPQNAYCIAVDGKSSALFMERMNLLAECFPNIHVMQVGPIRWFGYEIARAVFVCLKHLSESSHPWKYFQYLSGVDLPLKTNIEMVRIFKQLNGSMNVMLEPYPFYRLGQARKLQVKPPLPLVKSSLSALFSRETASAMVRSDAVREHLRFLQLTGCPDESLWGTIGGNPALRIPGGFSWSEQLASIRAEKVRNAMQLLVLPQDQRSTFWGRSPPATPEEPFSPHSYYISRYQVWDYNPNAQCGGKWTHKSCVFGVSDLPTLIRRAELVAHKIYMDVQPATFFCLYERIRHRALDPDQRLFEGKAYSKLAQVRLTNGERIENVKWFYRSNVA